MNQFYFNHDLLLSGQAAPYTGGEVAVTQARNVLVTVYASGVGSVKMQYKAPFNIDGVSPWVDFYNFTGLTTGYADSSFLDSPMSFIRAVSSGNGVFYAGIHQQN